MNCCRSEIFVFSKAGVIGRNSILISGLLADKNSVVVLIENGGSGGKIASPFAKDIFRFLNKNNKHKS